MKPINPNSWHWKVYCFNSQLVAAWVGDNNFHEHPRHGKMIGLCPYMRMICLWGPLVLASNLIPVGVVVATFYALPSMAAGWIAIFWLLFTLISAAALIIFLGWRVDKKKEIVKAKRCDQIHEDIEEDTFWSLFKGYVTTFKTKVCPVLEVPDDQ